MRCLPLLLAALAAGAYAQKTTETSAEETTTKKTSSTAATDRTAASTPLLVITVGEKALTTTFTPPASCASNRLTQLASPGYQIWVQEPMPVANKKIGNCYPPEFIEGYTSLSGSSSSIAPLMSPLVCPIGWHTAATWPNGYIACCVSGYNLHTESPLDPNRPAYGGTCFSDFTKGQQTTVTAYDDSEVTATAVWKAPTESDQAYGHVIDGFALDLISSSSTTSTLPSETAPPSDESNAGGDSSSGPSGGAIAGIVIGCVLGVGIIIVGAFFLVRRRAQQQGQMSARDMPPAERGESLDYITKPQQAYGAQSPQSGTHDDSVFTKYSEHPYKTAAIPTDARSEVTSAYTMIASPVSELASSQRHEMATTTQVFAELDGGYGGHEMEGTPSMKNARP